MADKSFVTLEQKICMVCGQPYDTGSLLLDQRMRDRFEMHTVTGIGGLCADDQKLFDDGYIALVEIDPSKSQADAGGKVLQQDASRTGVVVHMRRTAAKRFFTLDVPDDLPMIWIDPEVTAKLKSMYHPGEETE